MARRRTKALFNPDAYYRIDNTDGTLAMVVALDRGDPHFSIEVAKDADGRNVNEVRTLFPSLVSAEPTLTVALTPEAEVARIMHPLSYEEATALAPEFMAALKARAWKQAGKAVER